MTRLVTVKVALFATALAFSLAAAAQGRVLVEPVQAEPARNWLYDIKETRAKAQAVTEADARRISAELARSLQVELEKALRAQGFELAPAAGAGVVRLSARIDDLYVNAPESRAAGTRNLTREAGRAILRAEARDASGAVVMQSEERADAGDTGARLQLATDVSNRFWFDALFRDWSDGVARELRSKAR